MLFAQFGQARGGGRKSLSRLRRIRRQVLPRVRRDARSSSTIGRAASARFEDALQRAAVLAFELSRMSRRAIDRFEFRRIALDFVERTPDVRGEIVDLTLKRRCDSLERAEIAGDRSDAARARHSRRRALRSRSHPRRPMRSLAACSAAPILPTLSRTARRSLSFSSSPDRVALRHRSRRWRTSASS